MSTFFWYIENIFYQFMQMLPCMILALLVWAVVWPLRRSYLSCIGLFSPKRREIGLLLFVLFCAGLSALTLFPYGFWKEIFQMLIHPGYRPDIQFPTLEESLCALKALPHSFSPFREILRVNHGGPWLKFILWGNIGMFAPIGFLLPMLWKGQRWYHVLFWGGGFSLLIEITQVFVGRVSDIDDLILNTLGTMIGFFLYCIMYKVIPLHMIGFHCRNKEAL